MEWSRKRWNRNDLIRLLATEGFPQLPASHPARVTVRASSLAFSLAIVPSLVPLLTSSHARKRFSLKELLKREFGPNGFPFALVVVFGGSAWLEWAWKRVERKYFNKSEDEKDSVAAKRRTAICTLLASLWAIKRLQKHPKPTGAIANIPLMLPVDGPSSKTSPSLDLTIIFCVRALDALFQRVIATHSAAEDNSTESGKGKLKSTRLREHLDVILFTLATSRIMWCFVYQPFRLPKSYAKWINALADIDERLLLALRAVREGRWTYGETSPMTRDILISHAQDLGYPAAWGDPARLPVTGGPNADRIWQELGVTSRPGRGGLPCELVHGDLMTSSCAENAGTRWIKAFIKAFLIYLPVHTIPTLIINPRRIISDPFTLITAISRSSAFLATFVGTVWSTICLSRTVLGPKLFPNLPQQTIDGSFGGIALACVTCCFSLYIERGKRRGEIALYVLPRAIRTLFKESWLRSGKLSVRLTERLAFAFACAALVTFARYDSASLRGLSRWGLGFTYEGWDAFRVKREKAERLESVASQESVREYSPPGDSN